MSDNAILTVGEQKGILAITDMPRIAGLLEQLASDFPGIRVASDISNGAKELEKEQHELVVLQSHISGLSADILKKHLMNSCKNSQTRFALLADPASIKPEVASLFNCILNLSDNTDKLKHELKLFFQGQPCVAPPVQNVVTEPADAPAATEKTDEQPEYPDNAEAETDDKVTLSATGDKRPTRKVVLPQTSPFSKKLTINIDDLMQHQQPDTDADTRQATDYEQPLKAVTGRRLAMAAVVAALLLTVAAITMNQHKPVDEMSDVSVERLPEAGQTTDHLTSGEGSKIVAGTASTEKSVKDATGGVVATASEDKLLNDLPSFIMDSEPVPEYARRNPGWQCYQGPAHEYRIYRGKDNKIQAIQVIDRSGSGIRQSFYKTVIKELSGVDSMRTSSSEVKEGYEVRRGQAGKLQLIQYRDAQGGKLHGLVFTWP